MRIALMTDVYKPVINGVVHHVGLLKRHLEQVGEQVWLFVPGQSEAYDEANIMRIPAIPIADTGYHLTISLDGRSRELLQTMNLIHVHHPFLSGSLGLFASNRYNIPLLFTNHTRYDLYVKQYLPLLPSTLSGTALQAYFQLFSQRCAALIAPSQGVAEVMKSWGVQGRIEIIPNGIELERFTQPQRFITRQTLGLADDLVIAVYVGRMSGEKSVERLLLIYHQVAHETTRCHLLLVGAGPELEDYRQLTLRLGLQERVTITGSVPYEQVPDYLALSDFFVTTSVSEVHPFTLIEAAAAGLPTLGIRSPGVSDVIQDGQTGLLAEDNDLSFGLRFLKLINDDSLRTQLGSAAATYSHQLSAHTNARRILQLYREVTTGQ
jgi:glycosyltransferase involved in cell wall biosynthesis